MKDHEQTTLAGRAAGRDPQAILEHAAWLRSFARALVSDPNDADDLVQGAFGAALTTKEPIEHPRGFLAATTRRLASGLRRERRHRRDREYQRALSAPSETPPAHDALESMDTMRAVLEEVRELPDMQARTLSLRYVEGLEVAAIARTLGAKKSTVRSNLARGLASLRERLDGRFGERGTWSAMLIPMAFVGEVPTATLLKPTSGAERAVPAPVAAGLPAAAILINAMNLKLVAALAAPVLLTLGVLGLRGEAVDPFEAAPGAVTHAETGADMVPVMAASTERMAAPVRAAEMTATTGRIAPDVEPPLAPELTTDADVFLDTIEVQLVDAFAETPLFAFEVDVRALGEAGEPLVLPDTARAGAALVGDDRLRLATDEDGRLRLERLPAATATIELISVQRDSAGLPVTLAPSKLDVSEPEPVYALVGPTYRFQRQAPLGLERSWLVTMTGPGIPGRLPATSEVRWLDGPSGPEPWCRFGEAFGERGDAGPWSLEILSTDGHFRGETDVDHGRGSRTKAHDVRFEACGAIRFVMGGPTEPKVLEARGQLPYLRLIRVGSTESRGHRIRLGPDGKAGVLSGQLEPGGYRWEAPGQVDASGAPIAGDVQVATGETITVMVPELGGPHLDRAVLIDASTAPGADVASWSCGTLSATDVETLMLLQPEPAPDLGPGMWRVFVGPLPQPGWLVQLTPQDGYRVAPELLRMTASEAPLTFTVSPPATTAPVKLTLVDKNTGSILQRSDSPEAVVSEGTGFERVPKSKTGRFQAIDVAMDGGVTFLCRAKGYQLTKAVFEPGNGGRRLNVGLERGWRGLVHVLNLTGLAPLSGAEVVVDGQVLGTTDAAGEFWLDLDGPPDLIELHLPNVELAVKVSPFRDGLLYSADPLEGYRFLVE